MSDKAKNFDQEIALIEDQYQEAVKNVHYVKETFEWAPQTRPFQILSFYSDPTPVSSSSNTILI